MINQVDLRAYKSVKYVGDIHGLFKTLVFDAINRRKYKNCLIIVCGDIGFGFVSFNKEKENLIYLETDYSKKIGDVMTKENLITAPENTSIEEAKELLKKHKIEKNSNKQYYIHMQLKQNIKMNY